MGGKNIQDVMSTSANISTFIVTSIYFDEAGDSKRCLRRRAKVSPELWLSRYEDHCDGIRHIEDRMLRPTFLDQAPHVTFESREETRREVIKKHAYYRQARTMLRLRSSKVATKYALTFQTEIQSDSEAPYYELYFWLNSEGLALDFGVEAPIPEWLCALEVKEEDMSTQAYADSQEDISSLRFAMPPEEASVCSQDSDWTLSRQVSAESNCSKHSQGSQTDGQNVQGKSNALHECVVNVTSSDDEPMSQRNTTPVGWARRSRSRSH